MSKSVLAGLSLFLTLSISAQFNTVSLYEQCNYGGKKYSLGVGNHWTYAMKIDNDKLASLKIPQGMKVTLYEHDKFEGRSITYTSNVTCLPNGWIYNTSSIVVESDYNYNNYNSNDYVTFYNDCYSKGYSQSLKPGTYTGAQLGSLSRNISSFTIYGNLRVKVYLNNENLTGYSVVHDNSVTCLGKSENDKIASLVIEYRPYQPNQPTYPTNPNNYYGSKNFATVYTDCYYGGNSLRLEPGYYQGDKLGMLKYAISSIEIPSNLRAKVYVNNEYMSGNYYTLTGNTNCLSSSLNNRIGSIVIEEVGNYNYNPNYNNDYPNSERVVIYEDANYRGDYVALLPGTYANMSQINFGDNALSSLTVPQGYRVVLYEHPNFGGKSYTVTANKSVFTLSGWNDKTSSIAVYRDY